MDIKNIYGGWCSFVMLAVAKDKNIQQISQTDPDYQIQRHTTEAYKSNILPVHN